MHDGRHSRGLATRHPEYPVNQMVRYRAFARSFAYSLIGNLKVVIDVQAAGAEMSAMPFDGKRMIYGGFQVINED